jgi:hypothetical protein
MGRSPVGTGEIDVDIYLTQETSCAPSHAISIFARLQLVIHSLILALGLIGPMPAAAQDPGDDGWWDSGSSYAASALTGRFVAGDFNGDGKAL